MVVTERPEIRTVAVRSVLSKWQTREGDCPPPALEPECASQVDVCGTARDARLTRGRDVWGLQFLASDTQGSPVVSILARNWEPESVCVERAANQNDLIARLFAPSDTDN